MDKPKISVIMSVYNGEKYLQKAIESILIQTYKNFEFLIIDDNSNDSTIDIINSYNDNRIKVISNQANIGLTKSLNIGLELAKGEFIARQDADDISDITRFEKQIEYLNKNEDIAILGTQAKIINEKGNLIIPPFSWLRPVKEDEIKWFCMFDSPFIHSSVMMRKEIIWDIFKGYNSKHRTSQDYELWSRVVYNYKCENLNESLVSFRSHSNSVSSNYSIKNLEATATIIEHAIIKATGQIPPENFINHWLSILYPRFSKNKMNFVNLINVIDLLDNTFYENNNITRINKSIKTQKNYVLVKIFLKSLRNETFNSIRFLFFICKNNFGIIKIILKFLINRYITKRKLSYSN